MGVELAILGAAVIGGAATYAGGQAAKAGTQAAAQAQQDATKYAADIQLQMFNRMLKETAPQRQLFQEALPQLRSMAFGDKGAAAQPAPARTGVDALATSTVPLAQLPAAARVGGDVIQSTLKNALTPPVAGGETPATLTGPSQPQLPDSRFRQERFGPNDELTWIDTRTGQPAGPNAPGGPNYMPSAIPGAPTDPLAPSGGPFNALAQGGENMLGQILGNPAITREPAGANAFPGGGQLPQGGQDMGGNTLINPNIAPPPAPIQAPGGAPQGTIGGPIYGPGAAPAAPRTGADTKAAYAAQAAQDTYAAQVARAGQSGSAAAAGGAAIDMTPNAQGIYTGQINALDPRAGMPDIPTLRAEGDYPDLPQFRSEVDINLDADPIYRQQRKELTATLNRRLGATGQFGSSEAENVFSRNLLPYMQDAYSRELDEVNRANQIAQTMYGLGYTREQDILSRSNQNALATYGLGYDRSRDIYGADLAKIMDQYNISRDVSDRSYGRVLDMAKIGAGAASSAGQNAMATGQGLASTYMRGGSTLAGIYGQQGANQAQMYGALGGVGMGALNNYALYQMQQPNALAGGGYQAPTSPSGYSFNLPQLTG